MKQDFRNFCGLYTEFYSRNLILPVIKQGNELEAVLIEFRPFIQVEFLIRNAIFKLGSDWSFTVICGNQNYDMFKTFCELINPNIKVIKLNYDNLDVNGYNNLMLTNEIWNLLTGNKILIYQEDTFIFNFNIKDFLEYDYIGAPWPLHQNENKLQVGNGGFSLRNRELMLYIVDNVKDHPHNMHSHMNNIGFDKCPEDVYFSKVIIDLELGKVADHETAKRFSIETINCQDSLGGHCFWLCDPNWKNRLHKTVIQFQPNHEKYPYEHRGGWQTVLDYLQGHQFYNENSEYKFFDVVEHQFLWNTNFYCDKKWSGIIHCTQKTPDYLNCVNIRFMFDNHNFIRSLDNCFLLICTSEYTRRYTIEQLVKLGKNVPTICIKHPINEPGIPFDINKFNENQNKQIIQIGQQLRIMSSIYLINAPPNFSKIWLTGTKNTGHVTRLLHLENKCVDQSSVKMYYTDTFQEYDELLSKNIVFLHLFDAAANNTVLECIIRNTPIIVNRIESVVEYLGEDYPLYFNEISEVPDLLNKVEQAHIYLKNMDKTSISMDYFYKQLLTSINYAFNGISLDLMPKYLIKQEILQIDKLNKDDYLIEPELLSSISNVVNEYKTIFIEQMKINFQNNFNFQVEPRLNCIINEYSINFIEQMEFKIKNEMILQHLQNLEFKLLKQIANNKIIDCFIFYNELDLLTYRLNILNEIVDYFVLVESTLTFSGNPKELYYQENKHLFEKFNDKIIHIVVDEMPFKFPDINKNQQWENEEFQRNSIKLGISKLRLNNHDLIIIADIDEIPDPETLNLIKNRENIITINPLEMDFYYYNLNTKMNDKWLHCKIVNYSKYKEIDNCSYIRLNYWDNIIKNGGWHLSYFGNPEIISNKIKNFSHQEFNLNGFTDISLIQDRIKNGKDIFDRPIIIEKINLKENKYLPPNYLNNFIFKFSNEYTSKV